MSSRSDAGNLQTASFISAITSNIIPCGDFNWIGTHLRAWPAVDYIGFDIVGRLVKRNQGTFPDRRFARLDIVAKVPPPSDLIFCKDLLNHLETGEIIQAIANMRRSGSKYRLASNIFGYPNQKWTRSWYGSSRHVDLVAAPFCYSQPIWHDHYFGLWLLADMKCYFTVIDAPPAA